MATAYSLHPPQSHTHTHNAIALPQSPPHPRSFEQRKTSHTERSDHVDAAAAKTSGSGTVRSVQKAAAMSRPKIRPRGESDLGRPATRLVTTVQGAGLGGVNGFGHSPFAESGDATLRRSKSSFEALPESVTGLLIPLPFVFASFATHPPARALVSVLSGLSLNTLEQAKETRPYQSTLVHASLLSSGALLLAGCVGRYTLTDKPLDRRKAILAAARASRKKSNNLLGISTVPRILGRIFSTGLPIYAATQLGGVQVGLILLLAVSSGIVSTGTQGVVASIQNTWHGLQRNSRAGLVILAFALYDASGLFHSGEYSAFFSGYASLLFSILVFPPPLPALGWATYFRTDSYTTAVPATPWESPVTPKTYNQQGATSVIATTEDASLVAVSGAVLASGSLIFSVMTGFWPRPSFTSLILSSISILALSSLMLHCQPLSSRKHREMGALLGCTAVMVCGDLPQRSLLAVATLGLWLPLLSYGAIVADARAIPHFRKPDLSGMRARAHQHDQHLRVNHSMVTKLVLGILEPGSILYSIMLEKDSRRIAYFACLNLAFMLVQFFYGFVSGSLGLLTDSIHMLFDCAGLAVGLAAAVMSKWPPSFAFPYGYNKIDSLSGFANGIFLLLVSVEIIFDALHRLREGHELHRLNELLIVSILGFIVNIVGLTAFGHAHHGHGHDHSHGHEHSHDQHNHAPVTALPPPPDSAVSPRTLVIPSVPANPFSIDGVAAPPSSAPHSHHHSHHDNENMRGIFLHILADALGSFSVILSTLLTQYTGWHGWDPIASCMISVLIFASAVPLVRGAATKLLLSLPDDIEYSVRSALGELQELRGVVGIGVVRVWQADSSAQPHKHGNEHDHDHDDTGTHDQNQLHHHHHHHHHEHEHDLNHEHGSSAKPLVAGIVHVIAAVSADVNDVRERVALFLHGRGMDLVIHVEREGDGRCWCRGSNNVKNG